MKYASVCSGIEAPSVAWDGLGWQPQWFSEIEKFPCRVLAHHYPTVPNLGDMTKLMDNEVFNDRAIDLLIGGTPCQSFSVAGLRAGLADPRGNLALVYLALAARKRPRWLIWENVPGVLSSNGGRDFGAFLGALGQCGYGFAYRVLDAQYFGVAQRRRRVFVIGHLGDWRPAAAVLFEQHGMQGHPAPRRQAGEGFTHATSPSLTASGRGVSRTGESRGQDQVVATLTSNGDAHSGFRDEMAFTLSTHQDQHIAHTLRGEGYDASEDGSGTGHLLPMAGLGVRRLTPTECERLQGFPDGYTLLPPPARQKSREMPDGPRYKALGNSQAVPNIKWLGVRIQAWEDGHL